jgi:uncharacterized protein YacL
MKLQVLIRPILGVIFAIVGFALASRFLNIPDPGIRTGAYTIATVAFGAAGIFVVPVVSVWLRQASGAFAQRVANEVISQLHLPRIARGPRKENKAKEESRYVNPIVVDTSALIDGRLADVVEAGFLYGTLIIPSFILSELQHIADASDALRRGRGRRGLEILENLKKSKQIKTVIYQGDGLPGKNIDEKLLRVAKQLKAKIVTTDFNLNKVATVSGIKILNVNELVNALKTTLLPGEPVEVKVIQEGKEKSQGVGYLSDGTMIVVENGAQFIGQVVKTTVSRVLQTVAGRMIFVQAKEPSQKKDS